ncbi:Dbt [Symbiodinium microadriaticum]|nr:Dbt [Symbiodinium microadriaticum]
MAWYVKVGDRVKAFDKICEVQSDKATVEITSRYDGLITAVHHAEGGIVKVGEALVDIQQEGGEGLAVMAGGGVLPPIPPAVATQEADSGTFEGAGTGKVLTTPAVRKIAKENKVDLGEVTGTGPKGRILKEDILNFIKNPTKQGRKASTSCTSSSTPAPTRVAPVAAQSTTPTPSPAAVPTARAITPEGPGQDVVMPIRGVQRLMVKSMSEALKVPHLTYCEEVTMNSLMSVRKELKSVLDRSGQSSQVKMSFMPLIIKATEVTYHADHNLGIAMDTPKGLIVPVVKQVQLKSPIDIARELTELQVLEYVHIPSFSEHYRILRLCVYRSWPVEELSLRFVSSQQNNVVTSS